jgi:hypothetical protein
MEMPFVFYQVSDVCGLLRSVNRGELNVLCDVMDYHFISGIITENELKEFLIRHNKMGEFWFEMITNRQDEVKQFA